MPLNFAIIGAQKSASTFLQQRLAQHPDIAMLPDESRHFEDPEYGRGAMAALAADFADAPQRCHGVKRPDYLAKPEVPARVAEHAPSAKLMLVLREPVSRALSAYFHLAGFGFLPVCDPDTALSAILSGQMQQNHPKAQEVLDYGCYASHLRRWRELFAPEQFLVLRHDEVARDPATCLRRSLSFLGVDDTVDPAGVGSKVYPGVYWAPRVRLRHARSRLYFDYDPTHRKIYRKRLRPANWAAVAALTAVDKLVLSRLDRATRPTLSESVRQQLADYYAADMADLESLLDWDLRSWRSAQGQAATG